MGATINWRPVKKDYPSLSVMAPQNFMDTCEKVFGHFPYSFSEVDLPKIDTLIDLGNENPWKEIKKLIDKHDSVKLWSSY